MFKGVLSTVLVKRKTLNGGQLHPMGWDYGHNDTEKQAKHQSSCLSAPTMDLTISAASPSCQRALDTTMDCAFTV